MRETLTDFMRCLALLGGLFMHTPVEAQAIPKWAQFDAPTGLEIYEPSGIAILPDNRILVIQDESRAPFSTFSINSGGQAVAFAELTETAQGGAQGPYSDLEAMALAPDGSVYATTSHSLTQSRNSEPDREKLLRLSAEAGSETVTIQSYGGLKSAVLAAYPDLAASILSKSPKGRDGFNIEALAFDPSTGHLLIGLRGPVLNNDSLILSLENPEAVFAGDTPQFAAEMIKLKLGQQGLRAMTYCAPLGKFLIIGQKASHSGNSQRNFHLWAWSGPNDNTLVDINLGATDLRKAEGLNTIHHNGHDMLLLVSDDGERKRKRQAHYLLLPLEKIAAAVQPDK